MAAATREFRWDDEARVITWPQQPAAPHYHADLAACVARAIEVRRSDTKPAKVEIEHASGMIEMPEIEAMAADPSFPADPEAKRLRPDSLLP